jgi:hypothetical protein
MVIEYQNCMLPHAHIVVIIHPDNRRNTSEDIDKIISAEIPREPTDDDNEENTEYLIRARTAVLKNMVHGPYGAPNPSVFLARAVKGAA